MVHAHWYLVLGIRFALFAMIELTYRGRKFLEFVHPVMENTQWADNKERAVVLVFS